MNNHLYPPLVRKTDTINQRVLWSLKVVSFLMAFDLMVVFLTVRDYWVIEGGSYTAYGLVFSSYSIAQFVCIPVVSSWMDKHSLKPILLVTVGMNVIGNFMYGLGGTAHSRALIVIGRILAGVGAANIVTGPFYIVQHTADITSRSLYINNFNLFGFFGRVAGPLVAFAIFYIPNTTVGGLVLDFNTDPPLITGLLGIVVFVFILLTVSNEETQPTPQLMVSDLPVGSILFPDLVTFLAVSCFALFCFWGWYVNLVTFAGIQYGFADQYGNNVYLRAYLPALVGSVVGTWLYKVLTNRGLGAFSTLFIGPIMMAVGLIMMMDIGGNDEWRLWVGSIFVVGGSNFVATSTTPLYSHIVEKTGFSGAMARLLGLVTLAQALGRGLGPIWPPLLLKITSRDPSCCTFESEDITNCSCCDLHGVNLLNGILAGGALLVGAFAFIAGRAVLRKYPPIDTRGGATIND